MKNREKSWRGQINKLISDIQKKRGDISEARFFAALVMLVKAGFIRYFLYTNQRRINILKRLDYIGVDFIVFKNDGSALTVQVKSSDSGVEKFKKKCLGGVKVVQIDNWENIEETIRKAIEVIFEGKITLQEVMNRINNIEI